MLNVYDKTLKDCPEWAIRKHSQIWLLQVVEIYSITLSSQIKSLILSLCQPLVLCELGLDLWLANLTCLVLKNVSSKND